MALMIWTEEFSVGVKQLDGQHMQLIDTLNKLQEGVNVGQNGDITKQMLKRLMDYTNNHFATEEDLLVQIGYPKLAEHRAEHAILAEKVEELATRHGNGEIEIYAELLRFLLNWLNQHILIEDKEYSRWLNRASLPKV